MLMVSKRRPWLKRLLAGGAYDRAYRDFIMEATHKLAS